MQYYVARTYLGTFTRHRVRVLKQYNNGLPIVYKIFIRNIFF